MKKIAKVQDNPDLIRDMGTQAILNTNIDALSAYKKQKAKHREIDQAFDDINNMKQEMSELKTLMQRILDKIG
jgi:protein subunit release factor A